LGGNLGCAVIATFNKAATLPGSWHCCGRKIGLTGLFTRFEAALGKLGLSPADRSEVVVIKRGGENPYAEFG